MKFFHKDIILDVPSDIYYPREDSMLLAKILEKMPVKGKKCLDIGCGSGFLSILMSKNDGLVTCTDINPVAVEMTEKNAKENIVELTALVSDLFENIEGKFDLIVFNPPYLPEEIDENIVAKIRGESKEHLKELNIMRQWAGGKTGREVIERFVENVKDYLKENGKIIIGISSLTGEKEVLELFKQNGFSTTVIAREKIPWEELIVIEAHI